ncbi:MAG: hypothetical protein Q9207_006806 [Kuettlingeria erythrocarpa]
MASTEAYGQRLLARVIDEYAGTQPDRAWAAIPRSDDLTQGFRDITFRQFAQAIDRAAFWLEDRLGASDGSFETFAYAGDKDLRYSIIAVAAVKVGRKILLPSPFTTNEAQVHLLKSTECRAYVCSRSVEDQAKLVTQGFQELPVILAPELQDLLQDDTSPSYAYTKSWDEAKNDPWIIFHTSGTTGLPKPIVYTNMMMTSIDAARTMPNSDDETILDHYAEHRWYTPLPSLHFVGMTATLQFTVFLGSTVVFGPSDRPATVEVVSQILDHARLDGMIVPPSLLEGLCGKDETLTKVQQLEYVQFAGAPLRKEVGDMIAREVRLVPAIGSTEAGAWFPRVQEAADWNYSSFMKGTGIAFEHRGDNLYELVFRRQDEYRRWQQVFDVYPDLDVFHTKDLFTKHPTKHDLWAYAGRADGIVNLSHGKDLHAAKLERIIESDPRVRCALVGGEGRLHPFLILELSTQLSEGAAGSSADTKSSTQQAQIDDIWPVVEEANQSCIESVRLTKGLTLIAGPDKPFPRTAKGSIARHDSAAMYGEQIDALYARAGELTPRILRDVVGGAQQQAATLILAFATLRESSTLV